MEWEGREESSNVEDRRGMGMKMGAAGGGVVILVLIVSYFLGIDPRQLLDIVGGGGQPAQQQERQANPAEDRLAHFSSVILRSTEKVWSEQFREIGKHYTPPKLVLYDHQVHSACGNASSSVGPFYCGADEHVYLDLSFFHDMEAQLNAPGEFARAYVIAHEVGHHVQHLLGYSARAEDLVRSGRETQNQASVRLELQADFLAGVWAHHAKDTFKLNKSDIQTAIHAAYEIGDDRLQKRARGQVFPEKFTHGTSQQRMHWFMEGYKTGDMNEAGRLFTLPYGKL